LKVWSVDRCCTLLISATLFVVMGVFFIAKSKVDVINPPNNVQRLIFAYYVFIFVYSLLVLMNLYFNKPILSRVSAFISIILFLSSVTYLLSLEGLVSGVRSIIEFGAFSIELPISAILLICVSSYTYFVKDDC